MPIIVGSRPALVNFSDNPSYYALAVPFTTANQKLQVRVYVDDPVTPKTILLYPPYMNFLVRFSINSIVKPLAVFVRPKITDALYSIIQSATTHKVRAWIDYRIFDPTSISNPAFTSDAANVSQYIRGGYGLWGNAPNFDFEDKRKWFFTWQPTDKLVGPNEPHWLLYCHPFGVISDLEYTVYYTDGSEALVKNAFTETEYNSAERQYDQWFIPTGVHQCGLQDLHPDKTIHKYRVRVLNRSDETVLAEYRYRVDYRPNYDSFVLYYRNSLGGWDSLRILGEWEEKNTFERKEYRREIDAGTAPFDVNSAGAAPIFDVTEKRKWKANTGHLSKSDIDSLRDLMITKEMAIIKNKTWIPLKLTSDTLSGLSTKESLQNFSLEFESAFENKNYTPDTLPWKI